MSLRDWLRPAICSPCILPSPLGTAQGRQRRALELGQASRRRATGPLICIYAGIHTAGGKSGGVVLSSAPFPVPGTRRSLMLILSCPSRANLTISEFALALLLSMATTDGASYALRVSRPPYPPSI